MNKEQQIKEIAEIATTAYNSNHAKLLKEIQDNAVMRESKNPPTAIATALYNAGYRKQSDTIKEFADKIIAYIREIEFSATEYEGAPPDEYVDSFYLELKIKALAKEYGVEVEK